MGDGGGARGDAARPAAATQSFITSVDAHEDKAIETCKQSKQAASFKDRDDNEDGSGCSSGGGTEENVGLDIDASDGDDERDTVSKERCKRLFDTSSSSRSCLYSRLRVLVVDDSLIHRKVPPSYTLLPPLFLSLNLSLSQSLSISLILSLNISILHPC